jgi:hypothetical protein
MIGCAKKPGKGPPATKQFDAERAALSGTDNE